MPELRIDRLNLRLPGAMQGDARHLAGLVAERLAELNVAPRADLPALQMTLTAVPGTTMQSLSEQIVAQFVRELNRTL